MEQELIGVITLLEDPVAGRVREFWDILEEQYDAHSVKLFEYPSVTLQGGRVSQENLRILKENFYRFASKVHPFTVEVRELGRSERQSLVSIALPWKQLSPPL